MKAKPMRIVEKGYKPCAAEEATHIHLRFPGPIENRILPITLGAKETTPQWNWNGDVDKPTLRPSIMTNDGTHRCHTFVTDGIVEFLGDCTHELAGQKAELLDVD